VRGGGGALGGLSAVRETTEVPLGRAARLGAIARAVGEVAHRGRANALCWHSPWGCLKNDADIQHQNLNAM
jgi:hypothetical protein